MEKLIEQSLKCFAILGLCAWISSNANAAGTSGQRRACRADAMHFCKEFVPHVSKITACMKRNLKRLSPQCQAQFK